MMQQWSQRFARHMLWGLRLAPREAVRARMIELRWRWPVVASLCATTPAFYADLQATGPRLLPAMAYLLAAAVTALALLHTGWRSGRLVLHLLSNPLDLVLVPGLLLAAALPAGDAGSPAVWLRLAVAFLSLVRIVWAMQRLISRGGVPYLLVMAAVVLVLCGVGYWWLEPTTPTFGEGLWLAFVTAATVGYGDVYPTTPAAKIFSFFVVLLGFGVLSVVMAAIAAHWVETEERVIEREILHDVHRQMNGLRQEIAALRSELAQARQAGPPLGQRAPPPPPA